LQPFNPPTAQLPTADKQQHSLSEPKDYRAVLLSHIAAHKFYPRAARKRGIEGTVDVSFVLLGKNKIITLAVKGGHKLLRHAAEKTIRNALPLPDIPKQQKLPMTVAFPMAYELR
jgi:protein TonB